KGSFINSLEGSKLRRELTIPLAEALEKFLKAEPRPANKRTKLLMAFPDLLKNPNRALLTGSHSTSALPAPDGHDASEYAGYLADELLAGYPDLPDEVKAAADAILKKLNKTPRARTTAEDTVIAKHTLVLGEAEKALAKHA